MSFPSSPREQPSGGQPAPQPKGEALERLGRRLSGGVLGAVAGHQRSVEFFAGWVTEYSLSVDNLFVFVLVFQSFRVELRHQHRMLFWGVLGALVMQSLQSGMTLLNFDSAVKDVIVGSVLVFAVWIDQLYRRRQA